MTTPMKVHGADLSHHNADPALVRARNAGLRFVYHKATEGSTVRDPLYTARRSAAKKARLPFGAYHFASPDSNDAVSEARAFIKYADPQAGDLVPALDMEVAGSARLEAWSSQFMAEVMRLLKKRGLKPRKQLMHYGPDDYGTDYPFLRWVPRYNNQNERPKAHYDIWQFSNGEAGVPHTFPGLPGKVDLNTMRAGLSIGDFQLVPIKQKHKQPKLGDVIAMAHASLQYSLTPEQHAEDIPKVFAREAARGAKWITGTEAGPGSNNTPAQLKAAAEKYGYRLYMPKAPTDGWVAVAKDFIDGEWKTGYIPVIEGAQQSGDPHHYGPKGVVWVSFYNKTYGTISVATSHHLTKGRYPGAEDARTKRPDPVDHYEENKKLSLAIAAWALEAGKGGALVFFGGDTNLNDAKQDVFFGAPLTTLGDELGVHPGTGHGSIDVIATLDKDGRVTAKSFVAVTDKELDLHMDHYPVEGEVYIKPVKAAA